MADCVQVTVASNDQMVQSLTTDNDMVIVPIYSTAWLSQAREAIKQGKERPAGQPLSESRFVGRHVPWGKKGKTHGSAPGQQGAGHAAAAAAAAAGTAEPALLGVDGLHAKLQSALGDMDDDVFEDDDDGGADNGDGDDDNALLFGEDGDVYNQFSQTAMQGAMTQPGMPQECGGQREGGEDGGCGPYGVQDVDGECVWQYNARDVEALSPPGPWGHAPVLLSRPAAEAAVAHEAPAQGSQVQMGEQQGLGAAGSQGASPGMQAPAEPLQVPARVPPGRAARSAGRDKLDGLIGKEGKSKLKSLLADLDLD